MKYKIKDMSDLDAILRTWRLISWHWQWLPRAHIDTNNFKNDDLGFKEEHSTKATCARHRPENWKTGTDARKSQISMLSHCKMLTDKSYSLDGESTNFCVQCRLMTFNDRNSQLKCRTLSLQLNISYNENRTHLCALVEVVPATDLRSLISDLWSPAKKSRITLAVKARCEGPNILTATNTLAESVF